MADINDSLESIALQFANKVDLATSELVTYLLELVSGKSSAQALEILSSINLESAYELKMAKGFSAYDQGIVDFLKQTYTTASLSESTITSLLNLTKNNVQANISNLSSVTAQNIINGISTGKTVEEVILTIKEEIQNPELVVNTAYNQFSNSLTTMLAEELPPDTRFVYIGAYDGSTRPRCVEKINFSGSKGRTREEIISRWGDMNNEIYRCRHQWEQRSSSPEDQGYNEEEFVDAG